MTGLDAALAFGGALVDVSLPLRPGMFPIAPASDVAFTTIADHDDGLFETQLRTSVHAGTHLDYPLHVDPNGARAFPDDGFRDAIFPEHTLTLAYLMPFPDKRGTEPLPAGEQRWGDEIGADEIDAWLASFDTRYPGFPHRRVAGAMLRTGWNDGWFEPDFWRRGGPTLSDAGARRLVARGLRYLASDFPFTFEPGRTHDIVMRGLEKGEVRFQVEGLCNLGALTSEVVALLVAPLKLQGLEAAPARVYALDIDLAPYREGGRAE